MQTPKQTLEAFYAQRSLLPTLRPVLVTTDAETADCLRRAPNRQVMPSMISSCHWQRAAEWCQKREMQRSSLPSALDWSQYAEWAHARMPMVGLSEPGLPKVYKSHSDMEWASIKAGRRQRELHAHLSWRRMGMKLRMSKWLGRLCFHKELVLPRELSSVHSSWDREVVREWTRPRRQSLLKMDSSAIMASAGHGQPGLCTLSFKPPPVTAASLGLNPSPAPSEVAAARRAVNRLRQSVGSELPTDLEITPTGKESMSKLVQPARVLGMTKNDKKVLAGQRLAKAMASMRWRRLALIMTRTTSWVGQSQFEQELRTRRPHTPATEREYRHPDDAEQDLADDYLAMRLRLHSTSEVFSKAPTVEVEHEPTASELAASYELDPPSDEELQAASRAVAHVRKLVESEIPRFA